MSCQRSNSRRFDPKKIRWMAMGTRLLKSFAMTMAWGCLSAPLVLAQYAGPQYQYPITQYPALPQYPAEAYQAFSAQNQYQVRANQHAAPITASTARSYGTAAVSDANESN